MNSNTMRNVIAGLVTSFAAISLGAAFGISSGRGALAGMLSAAIIPIVASLLGGTKVQASGPTAPMTTVSAIIIGFAYGSASLSGLGDQFITMVFLMHTVIMILAAVFKLGNFISFVPEVVVVGFMNGIAFQIWIGQIKNLFNLKGEMAVNLAIAVLTFLGIIYLPKIFDLLKVPLKIKPILPAILIMLGLGTIFTNLLNLDVQKVSVDGSLDANFFANLSSLLPTEAVFKYELIWKALGFALQLSLLGYLDSLLTSTVIDKMVGDKTNTNKELVAQGLANGAAGLLGGIPGAQATIRSVLLIKEGGTTRLAGVMVGVFTLILLVVFLPMVRLIAAASFVGILIKAGLDVLDVKFIVHYFQSQKWNINRHNFNFLILILTTLITVLVDLNVAVFTGTALFYLLKWKFNHTDIVAEDFDSLAKED